MADMLITEKCIGKWTQILASLGVSEYALTGQIGKCPCCGSENSYRWDEHIEFMICEFCDSKSGIRFAMELLKMDFKATETYLNRNFFMVEKKSMSAQEEYKKNRIRLDKIKTGLQKLSYDNPAGKYLKNRGINIFPDGSLFYHPGVEYWEGSTLIGLFPAMVGEIKNNATDRVTYQITYLTANGEKADVPIKKKNMPIERENMGACVRLFRFTDTLAVAEGKEKSIKFTEDTGIPCWSTEGSAGMVKWEVPKEVKKLIIVSDGDFVGKQAAYTLAVRAMKNALVNVVFIYNDIYITDKGEKVDYLDYANRIKSCIAE